MTIILVRESSTFGFEVFLLKRPEHSVFMGGNFVYPGGKLEKGDGDEEVFALSTGVSCDQALRTLGETDSDQLGLAYWIAGIRELFEEAGILLAYTTDSRLLSLESNAMKSRFALHRQALQEGKKSFLQMLKEEGLTLALDKCFYYAHWITPEARTVRFDTRFFVALCPPCQEASSDANETTEGVWFKPDKALRENLKGTIALSPPTLKTLEDLSRFGTVKDLLSSLPDLEKPPILPILVNPRAQEVLIFPWDPQYEGFSARKLTLTGDHGVPSGSSDNTTRLVLKDGRWLPYVKTV